MDGTGKFPHASLRNFVYMLIMYSHDAGYIHVKPIASRAAGDLTSAFKRGTEMFEAGDDKQDIERIDNECSDMMRTLCKSLKITIEKAPPGQHRTNAAERAIHTWKITSF